MMIPSRLIARVFAGYLLVALAGAAAAAGFAGGVGWAVLVTACALLLLGAVLAVLAVRALSRPLALLVRATQRLAEGDVTNAVWVPDSPDLPELAIALNTAGASLRERLDELTEERDRGAQTLDAMEDGVLLLDGAARLLVANPAARAWFTLPDSLRPGLPAARVLGAPEVVALVEEAMRTGRAASGVVTLVFPQSRSLAVRVTPLVDRGATGRMVVTLRDVTEQRRVEALRRDFVINASHELKTPVASIRALAETLGAALPQDPETARRFVGRLVREAERLDRLVQDLLDLSRVERGSPAPEPVDLTRIAEDVTGGYAELAEERGVRLQADLEPGVTLAGDGAQLKLLVSNLVDNAVRYTAAGGTVRLRLGREDGLVTIDVEDTGAGIPADELPRIFERFYRVDPARSRQTGGTGLGLAIVKHVTEAHGGTVEVRSELGRGSTFAVRLPAGGPAAPAV